MIIVSEQIGYYYFFKEREKMKKNYKKLLSAFAAFSIAASSAVIPTAVSADSSINVDGSTASVSSDKDGKILVASYESDGRLKSIKSQDIAAGATETVTVNENDKVLLWDGTDNIEPLTDAATVNAAEPTPTADVSEPTPTADVSEPTSTPGTDEPKPIGETIKFDFGSGDNVADGYYSVTKDTHYNSNIVDGLQFGLLGTDENDYKLGTYIDGMELKQGQVIVLKEGQKESISSADDDYIGSAPQEEANYKVAGDYPVRFSMKAENNHYYKVKVNLTGLDQTKAANATVFSERRHAIITDEIIPAGESKSVEFIATLQNVAIKDRDAGKTITYADDMLNVVALGDNVAVSSIEVTEIEHQPTMWLYTDSTGCDYAALLPYFELQNYGGTGQYLTKYLPEGITISNQGDGGINAADSEHWNAAKDNITAGDYVYVQYGHNHKSDSTVAPGNLGYLKSIPKYYEHAHNVGAMTIYAGPIDRHNASQYNAETNIWSSTLNGFSKAAKYYTEILITAGKAKADEFVSKATEESADGINIADSTFAWADEVIAQGITADGVKDVAFVDLNQPTLDWLSEVCEYVKNIEGSDTYRSTASDYYFRGVKGGSIDGTHANDGGADNTSSFFFEGAKETIAQKDSSEIMAVEAAVLEPLVTGMRDASPYVVPEEIVKAGKAPAGWPDLYVPDNLAELPIVIKDVQFNEDGTVNNVTVYKQAAKLDMGAYGIVEITIYKADGEEKGKIYSTKQVDNSWADGTTSQIVEFTSDVKLEEGDTYSAIVRKAAETPDNSLIVDTEDPLDYSAVYVPTDIDQALLPDEDGNGTEDFVYYGAKYDGSSSLSSYNSWNLQGSAGKDVTLGQDGDRYYANVISDGKKDGNANQGSFYLARQFGNKTDDPAPTMGTTGKYMVEMDMQYISGNGAKVQLSNGFLSKSPFVEEAIDLFTINTDGKLMIGDKEAGGLNTNSWTTVKYVLDMDYGKASLSVAGGNPVEIDMPNYSTTDTVINPEKLTHFVISANKVAFGIRISNLTVAKLKSDTLPERTLTVKSSNDEFGTVSATTDKATMNTAVTVSAQPKHGYIFTGWQNAEGTTVSTNAEYTFRLREDTELTAIFDVQSGVDGITDYDITTDQPLIKAADGTSVTLTIENVVDKNENPVEITRSDVEWSCDTAGVSVEDGVVTIGSDFVIGKNTTADFDVKAVINNIEKTYTLTAYSYDFYENVKNGIVSAKWDGRIENVVDKNAIVFPGSSTSSTVTLRTPVDLNGTKTITYMTGVWAADQKKATCGQPRTIEIYDSNGNKVINDVIGYSWATLSVGGTAGDDSIDNATASVDNAIAYNTWTGPVTITIDKNSGTGTVSFGEMNADITINPDATNIASIKLVSAKSAPAERLLGITELSISSDESAPEQDNAEQAVLNSLTDDETEVSGTYVVNLEDLQ